ncbi:MAG TPA: hypothetical protein PKN99_03115 [Cyclobacteriaceae bacterium]|nr:hypothetical protein [Cyclobacteriaceae bacterium]
MKSILNFLNLKTRREGKKEFTVIENSERVDFNQHSFKAVEEMVYFCTPCNCYHVKTICKEQYQEHIYMLFTDESKLGEMNHLTEGYD